VRASGRRSVVTTTTRSGVIVVTKLVATMTAAWS
jgi:hypothetical protein